MIEFWLVTVPLVLRTPPPVLFVTVTLVMPVVPERLFIPPPDAAVLPETVELTSVRVPSLRIPPPLFVAVLPQTGRIRRPFTPRDRLPQFRWTLGLTSGATAMSARFERAGHRFVARLCSPCRDGAHGVVHLGRGGLTALFDRRLVAVVETNKGQARGVLGLEPPPHRRR